MDNLLEIKNLSVNYGLVPILQNISVSVGKGEIIGVVGESGCGKSTMIYAVMGILGKTGYVDGGEILFEGDNLLDYSKEQMRQVRGEKISLIAQNPIESLHPTRRIKDQLSEMVKMHNMDVKEAREEMLRIMDIFRLKNPERILNSYAFELSGGMCQRASIAMAMVLKPRLLMADEPTSALDVITQKEVINELMKIRDRSGTSILIVSHNMGVISHMADKMIVMYAGHVFEYGDKKEIINHPQHPYTENLIKAVPKLHMPLPEGIEAIRVDRTLPGCPYCRSCDCKCSECDSERPEMIRLDDNCFVRCHKYAHRNTGEQLRAHA